jgi:flagellar basal-body rod protein FlgG
MLKALKTAASGMDAQQRKLDITANNLANVNTTGFKKSRAEFQEMLYTQQRSAGKGNPTGVEIGSGVANSGTQKSFVQGTLEATENPLDVAIEGEGFFRITTSDGDPAFTRAGAFKVDQSGALVTGDGQMVDPGIMIPMEAVSINITRDGTVNVVMDGDTAETEVGRLELTRFQNPAGLRSMGRGLFEPTEASGVPTSGTPGEDGLGAISQGFLEGSNVAVTEEMISMIISQRAYEVNSKVIKTADSMLASATNIR